MGARARRGGRSAAAMLLGHSGMARSIAALVCGRAAGTTLRARAGAAGAALLRRGYHASQAIRRADARARMSQGDLRARLARYHDDVDRAFLGWNGAWLDPGFRRPGISGGSAPAASACRCWRCRGWADPHTARRRSRRGVEREIACWPVDAVMVSAGMRRIWRQSSAIARRRSRHSRHRGVARPNYRPARRRRTDAPDSTFRPSRARYRH